MDFDTDNFEADVLERSYEIPVLVDFWAEWCGPCKVLGPILERIALANQERFAFVKLNTELYPNIAMRYRIQSIPNVKLFVDGRVVNEFTGALPEAAINKWLDGALPSPASQELDMAELYIAAGEDNKAAELLEKLVLAEPTNQKALLLLAQIYIFTNAEKAIKLVEMVTEAEYLERVEAIKTFADLFKNLETPENLPEEPVKEVYFNALKALKNKDFETALQNFIKVISKNRYYDNDASRKACIAIFKLLSEEHAITKAYRSDFSSALLS